MVSFDFNFWTLGLLLLNFALAVFVAFTNRGKAQADELKAVKSGFQSDIKCVHEEVSGLSERMAATEATIENAVDSDDLIAVHKRVDEIAAKLGPVQGRLDEISSNLQPLNGHLQSLGQQLGVVQGMLTALLGAKDKL